MSLIEGHAEHTMDVVGAELLPSLPQLRAAMTRRRESRSLSWRVLERLLGLSMKMRQYEVGRRSATPSSPRAAQARSRAPGAAPTRSQRRGAEGPGGVAGADRRGGRVPPGERPATAV